MEKLAGMLGSRLDSTSRHRGALKDGFSCPGCRRGEGGEETTGEGSQVVVGEGGELEAGAGELISGRSYEKVCFSCKEEGAEGKCKTRQRGADGLSGQDAGSYIVFGDAASWGDAKTVCLFVGLAREGVVSRSSRASPLFGLALLAAEPLFAFPRLP